MPLSPLVAVHMTAAILATATGPVALWARLGATTRPVLHRAFGYAWVTLMIVAAFSAVFIRSTLNLSWDGFSPIHLLIPFTAYNLVAAFWALSRHDIRRHRLHMQFTYIGACIVAGLFTLLPDRYLGHLLWHDFFGLI